MVGSPLDISAIVILAGGNSMRFKAKGITTPKALVSVQNKALFQHVIERLSTNMTIYVSIHHIDQTWETYYPKYLLIPDCFPDRRGPAAGLLSAMGRLQDKTYLITVPCDCPQLPKDLIPKLTGMASHNVSLPIVAYHGDHIQPTIAIWPTSLHPILQKYLDSPERNGSLRGFLEHVGHLKCTFPSDNKTNPFLNINEPHQLLNNFAEQNQNLS